jgi:hypothetical protein
MTAAGHSTPRPGAGDARKDPQGATKKRTAVLVVHGMGSQRALDTVRGVVAAAWLDKDGPPGPNDRRFWLHPERKNDDLDLSVITTNEVPNTVDHRSVDFHELYWAHLLSETRAVAVLLWLFELVRKGPHLKRGMKALWWGATIFLCLLVQSVVLLSLHLVLQFLDVPAIAESLGSKYYAATYHEPEALVLAPFFILFMAAAYSALFSIVNRAGWIALYATAVAVASGLIYFRVGDENIRHATNLFLPITVSLCIAAIAMGRRGFVAMIATYILASLFFGFYLQSRYMIDWAWEIWNIPLDVWNHKWIPFLTPEWQPFQHVWERGWIFWSLNERYSAVVAFSVIALYLALYALFLQPFLGDAARYFRASPGNVLVRREIRRQAINTLDALHKWGSYDRIIVVAHSLGTVVAYDMLRAYFSRVNNALPSPAMLEPEFSLIDSLDPQAPSGAIRNENEFRSAGRQLIRIIASLTVGHPEASKRNLPTWLVTDFVTLGSPLTHAHYLMCEGKTEAELVEDFRRRVTQREFPTCPPERQDSGGLLAFTNPNTSQKEFHHAALFGMTRWTNLFFPMYQLFWGDAIGGPLNGIWGPYVKDVEVSTHNPSKYAFFTHTAYWSLRKPGGRNAPQIQKLREAINLEDR